MGTLTLSCVEEATAVNLTAQGFIDWALWSGGSFAPTQIKAGAGGTISGAAYGGASSAAPYSGDPRLFSWTDGSPNASASNVDQGGYVGSTIGWGFEITFPADTTTRTAKVYTSWYNTNAKVTAILSDGSVADQVDSTTFTSAGGAVDNGTITVVYAANSAGQTMKVRVEIPSPGGAGATVNMRAAGYLTGGGPADTTPRPLADISVTGWTSTGASIAAVIDEAVIDDADYATSPVITGAGSQAIVSLTNGPLAAGHWAPRVRASVTSGTATMRISLLNDSNAVQGSADVTVTSTITTFNPTILTTGSATRLAIEFFS